MSRAAPVQLVLLLAAAADAAPPTPTAYSPRDGGWTERPPLLRALISPAIPLDVTHFDFEVQSPLGTTVSQATVPVNRASSAALVDYRAPSPPDAGDHFWRARSVDKTGTASAWMDFHLFHLDDQPPPFPATVTVDQQDGGRVGLSCSPVVDPQSGMGSYHWVVGQLDTLDGGIGAAVGGPLTADPRREFWLGPGRWTLGVHGHDAVGNAAGGSPVWLPVVVPPATLPAPPPPVVSQGTGAPWPTAPYQNVNRLYLRLPDAGSDAGGYTVLQSPPDAGVWTWLLDTPGGTANVYVNDGRYELRTVAALDDEVTDYSATVLAWVDGTRPRITPQLDAGLAGGTVVLAWAPALDTNPTTTGSGILQYHVVRAGWADAGAQLLATVPAAGPLTLVDQPGLGLWEYLVISEDRAANRSADAGRLLVSVPPPVEAPPPSTAECGVPWSAAPSVRDAVPVTWTIIDAPPLAVLDPVSGLVSWTPGPDESGAWTLVVRAEHRGATQDVALPVEVACQPKVYGVACTCGALDGGALPLAGLALLALAGRRRRARLS